MHLVPYLCISFLSDRLIVSILEMEIYSPWLPQQIIIFTLNSTPLWSYICEDNTNITIKTLQDFNQGVPARAGMQGENLGDKTERVLRKMATGRKCLNTANHNLITSHKRRGKAIPEGSMRLSPPDFQTMATECDKDVCTTHWTFNHPLPPPEKLLVIISVRCWVDPLFIVLVEELIQWKIPTTSSGIEPATLSLVAQILNQLRQRLSQLRLIIPKNTKIFATYAAGPFRTTGPGKL
jgi:hypothetical protein